MSSFEALHVHLKTKSWWMNKVKDNILVSTSMATPIDELQLRECSPRKSHISWKNIWKCSEAALWFCGNELHICDFWPEVRRGQLWYLLHMSSNPCSGKFMRLDPMISHRGSKFVSSVCPERASCNSTLSVSLYSEGQKWNKEWCRDERPTVFFFK